MKLLKTKWYKLGEGNEKYSKKILTEHHTNEEKYFHILSTLRILEWTTYKCFSKIIYLRDAAL